MISYIRIKKHKALEQADLNGLGNINIICGKNNSGKTTVLEALLKKGQYSLGKHVDNVDWLVELFEGQAKQWTRPQFSMTIAWFKSYLESLVESNTIWYTDDWDTIIQNIKDSQNNDRYLGQFDKNMFNFKSVLENFFQKSVTFYNPVLIPPMRQLEFQTIIDLGQEVTPTGFGIVNKLFFLKNQDMNSDEYKTFKVIYDTFIEITGSKFNIVPDTNNQINLVYNTGTNWIPASDNGLGLSDVLIIISIINLTNSNVFLIEEPEIHLHAEYQKKLLKYFRTLKLKQFFITTHSSVFLDTMMVDKIFYCANDGEINLSDQTSKSKIINSLGYSVTENLVADLLILVEGPTDVPVLKEMLNWFELNSSYNIKFWPLGGDIMASLDLSVFSERQNVVALVDSDPGSSKQRTRFMRNCDKNGVFCKKLTRYSIENYFSLSAIKEVFSEQVPIELLEIDPHKSVDTQLGFKQCGKTIKAKNYEIISRMNISDIEETDLYEFLLFIRQILLQGGELIN